MNYIELIQKTIDYIDENNFDFEYYDERCHPWEYDKVSMEIHIPVKLK